MSAWVVRCEDEEGATYAYTFQLDEDETPRQVAENIAADSEMKFIEVMPIDDFLRGDIYELCTV